MTITVFKCSHCGKKLSKSDSDKCFKTESTQCSDCDYFESIGVKTSADYNLWLKGEWKCGFTK